MFINSCNGKETGIHIGQRCIMGITFWRHRDENNILFLHYADINRGLGGEMRKIAARLQIEIDVRVVSDLVKAEGFGAMKVLVDTLVPVAKANLWKKKAQFLLN